MTLGVKDLCERFAVGEGTILGWIARGELKALNVARQTGTRPKWRVSPEALAAFELLRTPTPPTPKPARRKRPADAEVIQFYT